MSVAGQFSVHLYTVVAASNLVKTSAQIAQDELDLDTPFKVNRAIQTAICKPQTTSLKSQTANRQIAIVTAAPPAQYPELCAVFGRNEHSKHHLCHELPGM